MSPQEREKNGGGGNKGRKGRIKGRGEERNDKEGKERKRFLGRKEGSHHIYTRGKQYLHFIRFRAGVDQLDKMLERLCGEGIKEGTQEGRTQGKIPRQYKHIYI
jgi:hypothetical protein